MHEDAVVSRYLDRASRDAIETAQRDAGGGHAQAECGAKPARSRAWWRGRDIVSLACWSMAVTAMGLILVASLWMLSLSATT
jgi:hypothetical protein